MHRLLTVLCVLSVPAMAQLQGVVRKVPGDFPSPAAAIAGANLGDIVLISPGTYHQSLVVDKSLSLIADGGTVRIDASVTVTAIPAGGRVHLRGLEIQAQDGLQILDSPGHVWVEGCTVISVLEDFFSSDATAIRVQGCDDVVLVNTRSIGMDQFDINKPLCEGLAVLGSTVQAYHCVFEGGEALDSSTATVPGAPGVLVQDDAGRQAELLLSGCVARGGDGVCSFPSCNGGNGAGLWNDDGTVHVADSTFVAGTLAQSPFCPCWVTPATWGSYTSFNGSPVRLTADGPKREGETLTLSFEGPPSVPVWYATSVSSHGQLSPTFRGSALLGPVLRATFAGTFDATGRIDVQTAVPPIVSPGSGIRLFVQAFSGGPAMLGGGTLVLLLDDSL